MSSKFRLVHFKGRVLLGLGSFWIRVSNSKHNELAGCICAMQGLPWEGQIAPKVHKNWKSSAEVCSSPTAWHCFAPLAILREIRP